MLRAIFRYHSLDALPALGGVGMVLLIVTTFLGFHTLPWWVLAPCFVAIVWSYCWNLQCISHNFIHNPFFQSPLLNRAFSLVNTVALGMPQVLYHHYHLNHHLGDNDRPGLDGRTKDWASTFRYGKDGQAEPFWRYVLLGFWRIETIGVIRMAQRNHHLPQAIFEGVVLVMFWGAMAWFDWQYFLLFYLPSNYLGWTLNFAEAYLEHYGGDPDNPLTNSVSSYHRLYNLLWFNNGYHQEHHWQPKRHWTEMQHLHAEIRQEMATQGTKVLYGPHITGFLEDWLHGPRALETPVTVTPRKTPNVRETPVVASSR